MYDSDTCELIKDAPGLDGVDLDWLPQYFTQNYATIVSLRLRLQDAGQSEESSESLKKIIKEMTRLALTHEAFVSVNSDRDNRASAAFIAGTAYQVAFLAKNMLVDELGASRVSFDEISPEVSATLLFLIAEANSDAVEMAKKIVITTEDIVEKKLLWSIKLLALGRLSRILRILSPNPSKFLDINPCDQAVRALYYLLFKGVRLIAKKMIRGTYLNGETGPDPSDLFSQVKALCIDSMGDLFPENNEIPHSLFPGPLHLASLLLSLAKDFCSSALINISPPAGLDSERWVQLLSGLARTRPYLWRNHRQAIASGYLEPGISAVISFPTGAGKSTLAELKIATSLLQDKAVVFLAPTLALVDQTTRSLSKVFPKAKIDRERTDNLFVDFNDESYPTIFVMTPERCLSMMSFERSLFNDVGLLVFDECHLMHGNDVDHSRRAIDSMLCVLNFLDVSPDADLLFISAMMSNASEIASWIKELTARPCLPLSFNWKPTRQVRGCVVYKEEDIKAFNEILNSARQACKNKNAPVAIKRQLNTQPLGLFSLRQRWQTKARSDYSLLPLLNDTIQLSTGTTKDIFQNWYLTPNGNQVASDIAQAASRNRLKTLVFTQTIILANSAAKSIAHGLGISSCSINENEKGLYLHSVDELGGKEYLYIDIDQEERVVSSCLCHHGLLLSPERRLHEALFKRQDGIDVIVATSTLSQGMNLPSQVVIIAGDSRFDSDANKLEQLEAHELLNAAGRAGRAGENSHGIVLVIPSRVIYINDSESTIHKHWSQLRAIFAQSDQCLSIDDPVKYLLDQLHVRSDNPPEMVKYFLGRLPIGDTSGGTIDEAPMRRLLGRSLAAYKARVSNDQDWINERVEGAINFRRSHQETPMNMTWVDHLAATVGLPINIIRDLGASLSGSIRYEASVSEWYHWLVKWLSERPHIIPQLLKPDSLEYIMPSEFKNLTNNEIRGKYAASFLFACLEGWVNGEPLAKLQAILNNKSSNLGKCEKAREYVIRVVPDFAYFFSLPSQVLRALIKEREEVIASSLGLDVLGSCVKAGVNSIEMLALRYVLGRENSRRAIHRKFANIKPYLDSSARFQDFSAVIGHVRSILNSANFRG